MAEQVDLQRSVPESGQQVDGPARPDGKQKKPKKDGNKRNKKSRKDVAKALLKVIIRRLPPTMNEETFREQIDPLPEHDDFYYVPADWTLGVNASCRAYITFCQPDDLVLFNERFDGYIFIDGKGREYPAVVEYAPFQELPRSRARKKDAKCNMIEGEPHYIAFKEALEAEEQALAAGGKNRMDFSFAEKKDGKATSTPLLEFIALRRQEKRDEKRRKQEEKRKARDEERQLRKHQATKSLPEAIKEEQDDGDDIVVRMVAARPDLPYGGQKGQPSGGKKPFELVKAKEEKEKKQKNRNKEKERKDGYRREESFDGDSKDWKPEKKPDQDRAAKKQNRDKGKAKEGNKQPKMEGEGKPRKEKEPVVKPPPKEPAVDGEDTKKREVKKYSERRKETRARAESRLAELEDRKEAVTSSVNSEGANIDIENSVLTADVPPFIPKEKSTIILEGSSSSTSCPLPVPIGPSAVPPPIAEVTTTTDEKSPTPEDAPVVATKQPGKTKDKHREAREAREARKIRNKDRPSIEIYQPRRRILSGTGGGKAEDDRGRERSDSDRPSDNQTGGSLVPERRHKLTKKSSDREQRERVNRRKSSFDANGSLEKSCAPEETVKELQGVSLEEKA